MKNGNALLARVEDLNRELADLTVLDLYRQQIPADIDLRLDKAVQDFMVLPQEEREMFQAALTPGTRSLFGIYGHRAATRAIREARPELLQAGLVASAIANYVVPDTRRLEVGLAVYHYSAQKLGINPADAFTIAADFATADLAPRFVAFGNRSDVTLKQFGWQAVQTGEGIQFKYDWK